MRSLFLTSSALFMLAGGVALAGGPSDPGKTTTVTATVPVLNATSSYGSSAATDHSTAVTANNNTLDFTKTLSDVGNTQLSVTKTDTHLTVVLGTSANVGGVGHVLLISGSGTAGEGERGGTNNGYPSTGNATMTNSVSGGSGIITAQQNAGPASLQQNSVGLGSYVGGTGTGINGF